MPSEASLRGGSRYLIEGTRLSKLSFVLGKRTKGRLGTGISRGFSLYPSDMDDAKADFLTLYSSPLLSQTTDMIVLEGAGFFGSLFSLNLSS